MKAPETPRPTRLVLGFLFLYGGVVFLAVGAIGSVMYVSSHVARRFQKRPLPAG